MKLHILLLASLVALAQAAPVAAEDSNAGATGRPMVRTPSQTDDVLAAEVGKKISEQPSLRGFRIMVFAMNGNVFIEGEVLTSVDEGIADQAARSVPGVKDVYNHLYHRMS